MSIRNIANKLGVTPMAIYRHFSDKEAILLNVKKELAKRLRERLYKDVIAEASLEQNIQAILMSLLDMFVSRRAFLYDEELFHRLSKWNTEDEEQELVLQRWHELLSEGIRQQKIISLPLYQLDALTIGAARECVKAPEFDGQSFERNQFVTVLCSRILLK